MAKRSQKRPVRYEKDRLGCMWGLISVFDFRHGRTTQRLLSDRRRSGRLAVGAGNPTNKLEKLTWNDNCQGTFDVEETKSTAADAGKPSVKSLIEEEMISEKDNKKEINDAEVEPKLSASEQGSHKKKSRKRMKKSRKKSCDSVTDLDVPESLSRQSTGSLDIDSVMEEFCHQIYQKIVTYVNHEHPGELNVQSNQKNSDFEEKMSAAIKLLISQKLFKGKHLAEDGEIHPSQDLMDALQILGSDGELFLEHLKDPNSLLVKCIENFPDAQLEKAEDSKSLAGSNFSEQDLDSIRQSDEIVNQKQRSFFRRKVKSQERSPLNGNKTSLASNKIVILKPGPASLQSPETESTVGSSPSSRYTIRNKEPNERISSHFFLTEIKRKLKNAMGKEHQRISSDGIPKGFSYDCQNSGDRDRGLKENVGIKSPSKDHFFIEKIARPVGVKKGDKTGKLKGCDLGTEHKNVNLPRQRVSNIYVEAKKHLSEMLSNGDENMDSSSGHVPKTLGRILSLPEYSFSPAGSPGRNWEHSFLTAQMRFVDSYTLEKVNEITSSPKQGSNVSRQGQIKKSLETQPSISDDCTDNKVKAPSNVDSNSLIEQIADNEVEKTSSSIGDEFSSKGDMEIVEINGTGAQEESNLLDAPCEPSSSSSIKDDEQKYDESQNCDGERNPEDMKEDSCEENQLPPSPLSSPSRSLSSKKAEGQESAIDMLERPSPVSVLEPLFAEDDISPASTRSHSVEIQVQPLRIQFEEHDASTDQNSQTKSSIEDKESILEYVKAVLQSSGLNWDDLFMKSLSTDKLLDLSLLDKIEFFPNQLCFEQQLLFDCINEVLMDVCAHYFGCSPLVSFAKPYIRPVPNMENALHEVWEGLLWHLLPPSVPHSLDQTVRKDMAKSGTWMDLRYDTDSIGIEMSEAILEELMEDTILSFGDESPELGFPVILAELQDREISINLES